MALSLEIVKVCSGGNHLTVVITEDGLKPRMVTLSRDELAVRMNDEDKQALVVNTLKYHVEKGAKVEDASGKAIVPDALAATAVENAEPAK